ncbi:putative E2-like enzyme [Cristinia sonorae]|uniref:Autophagy-related protein 3 n=1 Tax=Cristinia sonorae TaxID=1940300 RepID=A0A8K0XUY4_9AGAR|nr:putative E2-like enzyme [Cristinia sonorae]
MHAIQQQYWAVRDYLSPVLKESKFKEHGRITPEEFVAAGDFLTYKFAMWSWEKGDPSKLRDYLPADKQYLMTRGVPCLRRATSLAYTDEDEDRERLLSFGDLSSTGNEADEWVETHAGRKANHESENVGEIDDIPDVDDGGDHHGVSQAMGGLSISGGKAAAADEIPDIDDIPDMEEEDLENGDDEATATSKTGVPASGSGVIESSQIEVASGNLLQVRTYDVMITYDKYYQTPRIWLVGYDEKNRTPLTPAQIFQDVSADHAFKTVTIEPFPHSATLQAASVHPCKHASVMKKVIERMNQNVMEQEQKSPLPGKDKDKQKKWMFRKASGNGKDDKAAAAAAAAAAEAEDDGGMKVDYYLVVFLKFIASIVPTIEVDATTSF